MQQRYVLSLMGFGAIVCAYTMRVCLNMAITEMTSEPKQFEWDEKEQGMILGGFYIGYLITHVPAALLCNYFGGKYVLCLGILSTAILTLLTPLVADIFDLYGMVILRILMGLAGGTTFPALSSLLASWVPEKERGKLGSFVFGGGQFGTIFGNFVSGILLTNFSWPWVFYFFGTIAIVWSILFVFLCYSNPEEHPFIKASEKEYLRTEMADLKQGNELPPTPWKAIFTSVPMMALVLAQIGHDWGFYIIVTDLPKYLKDVLDISIANNGMFSSLPFFAMWISSIGSGVLCDFVINNSYMSVTNARKWLTGIAAVIPGILLLGASYAGHNIALVVVLFTLAMGFMGPWYPGMKVNPLDLSPNYAATIMAISNGIGAFAGAAAPYMVGVLTPNKDLEEWRLVFWITFGIFVITTVAYTLWASGEIQPWNDPFVQQKTIEISEQNDTSDWGFAAVKYEDEQNK